MSVCDDRGRDGCSVWSSFKIFIYFKYSARNLRNRSSVRRLLIFVIGLDLRVCQALDSMKNLHDHVGSDE